MSASPLPPRESSRADDFFSFRLMVTPTLVRILFVLLLVVDVVVGLGAIAVGLLDNKASEWITGLVILVFGPLVIRLFCEWQILLFSMHDQLVAIRRGLAWPSSEHRPDEDTLQ